VMFQVEVFWVVTPCSVVVGYHRFGGPCCCHLQGGVKMAAVCSSETLVPYRNTTQRHNPEDLDVNESGTKLLAYSGFKG